MTHPYQLDPEAMKRKGTSVQEERLVTLKDDSTHPPPTIGTPSWMSILGGPALGQPGSRHSTFRHREGSFLGSARFWLVVGFVGFLLCLFKAQVVR